MSDTNGIRYRPPGPVAAKFFFDRHEVSFINGPIGGGKTTANFMRHVHTAMRQERSWKDGVRHYRLCVIRDTYRNLWRSTIPSWLKRFPDTTGKWWGSKDQPARHVIDFGLPDGSACRFDIEFAALGELDIEEFMKGFEPTAIMLNEVDGLAELTLTTARGRAGRFPDMEHGGPTWYGVTGDLNAPNLGNWTHEKLYAPVLPPGWAFFRQPSGLSPDAENIPNLPGATPQNPDGGREYYRRQMSGAEEWYVDKFVRNKPGTSRAGKPVYREYEDATHCADHELQAVDGLPLNVGLDAGGCPAAAISQRLPNGQWRTLDELVSEQGTGANRFADNLGQLLHDRYPNHFAGVGGFSSWRAEDVGRNFRAIRFYADPSAGMGADRQNDEGDWTEIVGAALGVRIDLAPTNNPTARQAAVKEPLRRLIDGKPGYLLSPRCKVLREGFQSGYGYRKIRRAGETERFTEEVDKNGYSHPHDALQYGLLSGGEDFLIRGRIQGNFDQVRAMQPDRPYDPYEHR